MDLLWITDPHLNFLSRRAQQRFGRVLSRYGDALLVTGDIAESPTLVRSLRDLGGSYGKPVYFVLGNHDFWGGTFEVGRALARSVSGKRLHWLTEAGVVPLTSDTCLVGHDGFYDGRNGRPLNECGNPTFIMRDWAEIGELKGLHIAALLDTLRTLGEQAAAEAELVLEKALTRYRTVLFATHYPPYREASWHLGQQGDPEAVPWFTCRAMGDMLLRVSGNHPDRKIAVFCGHTHSPGKFVAADNLQIFTGISDYGRPQVSGLFTL
jgi:3',5'-cyclic AMP phosphodiesterase CpdA